MASLHSLIMNYNTDLAAKIADLEWQVNTHTAISNRESLRAILAEMESEYDDYSCFVVEETSAVARRVCATVLKILRQSIDRYRNTLIQAELL